MFVYFFSSILYKNIAMLFICSIYMLYFYYNKAFP